MTAPDPTVPDQDLRETVPRHACDVLDRDPLALHRATADHGPWQD